MFTRSMFGTADMAAQHRLLNEIAQLVDAGLIRTTLTETLRQRSMPRICGAPMP
jgi:hypothetical protein